ncbi:Nck-associated protein 5-like [Amphibalanus amphitrite]|uniref:Nck-associated protein 5-like n=1 Tax=Amphibalanus amphitrite TaxID=1232801 RepID=A0A6A4VPX9_AMPAM|nr:Nck-associated protein 5-like [Amphibalanus amphitrite]
MDHRTIWRSVPRTTVGTSQLGICMGRPGRRSGCGRPELARTETEGKLAAMEAIVKAHERERQCWLGQVHQLTGQLERLQAAAASTAETGSPSRADLEVRVRSLEAERDELERRADRCLDDVANQIVQALSRQKSLQNSLETVRRRVHQLEHENAVLFTLLGRPPQPVTSQPPVTSQTTLPAPAPSGGSSDDEQLTAVCAKVRRILEEHYGSSGSSGEEPPSEPLRWSQLDGLLSEGAAPAPCLLCLVPARPRPVHRCRSDSRLCVKRWAAEAAASRPWSGRAPERSSSTLELGAVSTLDTRRAASLKRAAGQASLERGSSPPTTSAFVPAALPWRDDSSELWRNCFSLEAREMEDWSLHLSAEELRSELTDEAAGSERLADSSDYSRVGSFPNIQEAILELEEDASECLWNNASYMHQRPWSSCEHISLADLRDAVLDFNDKNDLKSAECESRLEAQAQEDLKRHSNGSDAMSCASVASEDERPENLETEFTRDFYRLVKYESSKSLALSEASAKGDDEPLVSSADRELALASMLNFITEQQRYIAERETEDAAQAREPITDSDSASYTAMDHWLGWRSGVASGPHLTPERDIEVCLFFLVAAIVCAFDVSTVCSEYSCV